MRPAPARLVWAALAALIALAVVATAAETATRPRARSEASAARVRCTHGYALQRLRTREHGRRVVVRRCCRTGRVLRQFRTRLHGHIRYRYRCVKRKRLRAPAAPVPPATQPPTGQAPGSPAPGADPSGDPMPAGDLPGWRQVFSEDFTTDAPLGSFPGTSYGAKWFAYPGWHDTTGQGVYDAARTVSVSGGAARIHLHSENGVHYGAALVPRLPGAAPLHSGVPSGQLYGRYSVRFRADAIPDYKQAWLLWPDSGNWPADGEIDFPESQTDLASNVQAVLHHKGGTSGRDQEVFTTGQPASAWHTATTEWTPGRVSFYWDGRLIGTTTSRIPDGPMHWVLQSETQTWQSDGVADATQGDILIDWVAIWKPA